MSDTAYPTFQHYGTAAERAAFTPSPAGGTQPLYVWRETDTGNVYIYDTSWHLISVPANYSAAVVATDESTTSTSYTDLATPGPSVTMTLTGTTAIIWSSADTYRPTNNTTSYLSVAVSGATTVAASDANGSLLYNSTLSADMPIGRVLYLTGLTAGSNTFTLKYKVFVGTAATHFINRTIAVYAP